jgi:hypothetical protein
MAGDEFLMRGAEFKFISRQTHAISRFKSHAQGNKERERDFIHQRALDISRETLVEAIEVELLLLLLLLRHSISLISSINEA